MWWLAFGTVLFIGLLATWMPRLWRPDVPLGVNVPSDRVQDPVIAHAVHRYRSWVLVLTAALLALVGAVGTLAPGPRGMTALMTVASVGMVFGVTALMRLASQPIRDAKRREDWYAGKPVAVIASVTGAPDPGARPRWWWHGLALLILLGAAAYALVAYPGFPNPLPAHYGPSGVDRWEAKTWWAVLQPIAIGLAVVMAVAALSWSMSRQSPRILPGGDPAAAAADRSRRAAWSQQVVGITNVLCALMLVGSALLMWRGATSFPPAFQAVSFAAPVVIVVISLVVMSRRTAASRASAGPESPDQDRYWKWGAFYVNPDDPRLLVDKRTGLGMTFNFGHPAGKILGVVILLLAVGAPILSSVFAR